MTTMKLSEFHARIFENNEKLIIPRQNYENHEIIRIPLQKHKKS